MSQNYTSPLIHVMIKNQPQPNQPNLKIASSVVEMSLVKDKKT